MSELSPEWLSLQEKEIRRLIGKMGAAAIEIGLRLLEVRTRMKYGEFTPWVERIMPYDTAAFYIRVANKFGIQYQDDPEKFTRISSTALAELVSPAIADRDVERLLDRAKNGEQIGRTDAIAIKHKYRGRGADANQRVTRKVSEVVRVAFLCLGEESLIALLKRAIEKEQRKAA